METAGEYLGFGSLWLQVVIVAVATFVLSALVWMVAPWHKTEFKGLPTEDAVRKVLLDQGAGEGQYRIPFMAKPEDCKNPEFLKLFETGPVGILQFEKPAGMTMGPRLLKTFVFFFAVAFFTAYCLRQAFPTGTEYMRVFQLAGCVAFASHAFGTIPDHIWFSKSCRRLTLGLVDSLLYALVTAGIFASMWPS